MPLGQWMEMRGLMSWGARSTVKIGVRESGMCLVCAKPLPT